LSSKRAAICANDFGGLAVVNSTYPKPQDFLDTCESNGAKSVLRLMKFGMCVAGKMVGQRAIHCGSPEFTGYE